MKAQLRILMLEDNDTDAEIVQHLLNTMLGDCIFHCIMTETEYLHALDEFLPDVILADNALPQFDAAEALQILQNSSRQIPFILVTGTVSEEFAAAIIKAGADDYVLKDRLTRLPAAIETAIHKHQAEREKDRLTQEMEILSLIARETTNSVVMLDSLSGKATWINEGFTRNTGYTLRELQAEDIWQTLAGADTDKRHIEYIRRNIQARRPYACDLLIYSKRGELKWFCMSGQPMKESHMNGNRYFVIATDITERRRIEEEQVAGKIERQKEIIRVMLQTQEMERNALGRELHDNINQILASINLKLGYYLEEPGQNLDLVVNCKQTLQEAINEARNLSHNMVLPRFSERRLKDELELLVENYSFSKKVQLHLNQFSEQNVSSTLKETLFRIVQEQLSNIVKHAHASHIQLKLYNDERQIHMEIQDNGIGFDARQARKGIGLTNILNRVESYNGSADIVTEKGKGCRLSVRIPVM